MRNTPPWTRRRRNGVVKDDHGRPVLALLDLKRYREGENGIRKQIPFRELPAPPDPSGEYNTFRKYQVNVDPTRFNGFVLYLGIYLPVVTAPPLEIAPEPPDHYQRNMFR